MSKQTDIKIGDRVQMTEASNTEYLITTRNRGCIGIVESLEKYYATILITEHKEKCYIGKRYEIRREFIEVDLSEREGAPAEEVAKILIEKVTEQVSDLLEKAKAEILTAVKEEKEKAEEQSGVVMCAKVPNTYEHRKSLQAGDCVELADGDMVLIAENQDYNSYDSYYNAVNLTKNIVLDYSSGLIELIADIEEEFTDIVALHYRGDRKRKGGN